MKKVLEQYAGTVIAAITALGIFGILCGHSLGTGLAFSDYLGTMIKSALFTNSTSVRIGNAFDTYMNRTVPAFTTLDCTDIQNGETIPIASVLEVVDTHGNRWDIYIQNRWDENFSQTNSLQILEQTKLCFYDTGVFWIELYTTDSDGHNRHAVARVFANER